MREMVILILSLMIRQTFTHTMKTSCIWTVSKTSWEKGLERNTIVSTTTRRWRETMKRKTRFGTATWVRKAKYGQCSYHLYCVCILTSRSVAWSHQQYCLVYFLPGIFSVFYLALSLCLWLRHLRVWRCFLLLSFHHKTRGSVLVYTQLLLFFPSLSLSYVICVNPSTSLRTTSHKISHHLWFSTLSLFILSYYSLLSAHSRGQETMAGDEEIDHGMKVNPRTKS